MKILFKGLFFVVALIFVVGVSAVLYEHSGSDLGLGDFEETLYNSSGEFVQLNYSDSTNTTFVEQGNYTSEVIDFGSETGFTAISWVSKGVCPENMSYIDKFGGYCIDQYTASRPDATSGSVGSNGSMATSRQGVLPWVSINQGNANVACENAGKHLCSSAEWLGAANLQGQVYYLPNDLSGSPYNCNTGTSSAMPTGSSSGCVSSEGVYDMVGNVWEWNSEVVDTVKPCNVGSGGYCYVQDDGSWGTSQGSKYSGGAYFLAGNNNGRAVRRGGYWDSGADAGPFAVLLHWAPTDTGTTLGFRCCSEPELI